MEQSLHPDRPGGTGRPAEALLDGDAAWTDRRLLLEKITGVTLPVPAVVRAGAATGLNPARRLARLLG